MLKIKDNVDLKELEKFGFKEHTFNYTRKYNSGSIITDVNKRTRIVEDIETDYEPFANLCLGDSKRVNDLIKADLVEKVEENKYGTVDKKSR